MEARKKTYSGGLYRQEKYVFLIKYGMEAYKTSVRSFQ